MASRRFDIQAESAQARWMKRRSSTPPASVTTSSDNTVAEQSKTTEPATAAAAAAATADTALNALYDVKRRPSLLVESHRRTSSGPPIISRSFTLPPKPQIPQNPTMQAVKLQRKYPQVTQEEMFALIEKFK
jgi:hypothetical protein